MSSWINLSSMLDDSNFFFFDLEICMQFPSKQLCKQLMRFLWGSRSIPSFSVIFTSTKSPRVGRYLISSFHFKTNTWTIVSISQYQSPPFFIFSAGITSTLQSPGGILIASKFKLAIYKLHNRASRRRRWNNNLSTPLSYMTIVHLI